MNVALNFIVLIVGLILIGALWRLFSTDPEVKDRAKKYTIVFLCVGVVCYAIQYFLGLGI
ncbi:hypothetical protein SDC9_124628 [bioreactor metagenome]|uniref:Uncharacterized protein n=1 Tax=bioreactor metagenome TaxID=1076179 RepID=A0A645CKY9_9ZZZZ